MKKLILASKSPRRKQLLNQIGIKFEIITSEVDEIFDKNDDPAKIVEQLSYQKAMAVSKLIKSNSIILGADTIVYCNNQIMGKPNDTKEATSMLNCLSGNMHSVYTGLTLIDTSDNKIISVHEKTDVYMDYLSDDEINNYIRYEKPFDKAGAYGIQDKASIFIKKIDGDYFNIVGLPLHLLYNSLKLFGINLI